MWTPFFAGSCASPPPSRSRRLAALAIAFVAFALSGCAREVFPPSLPGSPTARDVELARGSAPLPLPKRRGHRGLASLSIPDGEACLSWLSEHDVSYRTLSPRPGVDTPVAITGPLGGVRYESGGRTTLICDCRLAVTLDWLAPELRSFGITEVHHSGAYVYRTTRKGGPSLHALGLAIDVHQLRIDNRRFDVERDYARGTGKSCAEDSPTLNRLACELDRSGFFREVLTPDDDYDHRNHLHLAISPL
ncbi:MAG TPA: extensin family protein [Polyangiaceae bacterium]|jgi:hypothetical protein|nr:extensin family protein [Polyangiaceae bacterium]